jgi:hypothetical protein
VTPLRAVPMAKPAGLALAVECERRDAAGGFAGSLPWLRAAERTHGSDRIVHLGLFDGDEAIGHLALQRTRASWRSGVPGRTTLCWPMQELGFGFRPRWRSAPRRAQWLPALRAALPDARLELARTAPDGIADVDGAPGITTAPGIGTWLRREPGSTEQWLASLYGKHRRDLAKYRRDIAKAGATWRDTDRATADELSACFALHRSRLHDKGARSAYFAAGAEQFLRALADATAGDGQRLTLLEHDGRFVAACLSFVHGRRLQAFVSGWDRSHARLDLGRQVLYHQILGELPHGLHEIDFLGGDLAYKREFGLQKEATLDVVVHGGPVARFCAHVVGGALRLYRAARRRQPQGVR